MCPQEQSLELGQGGIVNCSFATGFYGVYWYDTDDLTLSAFMFYANENKGGKGYDSGEFDILPDGSLVINIVGVKHEIPFTVVYMETVHTISPVQKKVQLTVIGKETKTYFFAYNLHLILICSNLRFFFKERMQTKYLLQICIGNILL